MNTVLNNDNTTDRDRFFMQKALQQAQIAYDQGEVPVGAIVVDEHDHILSQAYNRTIQAQDPTAHAEIVALRLACQHQQNYRLPKVSVYVTLEPCVMCLGALFNARVARIVYGAREPKTGACGSMINLSQHPQLNHHALVMGGVQEQACATILRQFFQARRKKDSL